MPSSHPTIKQEEFGNGFDQIHDCNHHHGGNNEMDVDGVQQQQSEDNELNDNNDNSDTNYQYNNPADSGLNWNIIKNPSNGRTRISQACDRCRARKIKCSGKSENNPKCTNCEKDGFPCIVSDKLTRNSFPKGYTKNLEKKLLDVELNRNQLLLELNNLKQKLAAYENNNTTGVNPSNFAIPVNNNVNNKRNNGEDSMTIDKEMLHTLSYGNSNSERKTIDPQVKRESDGSVKEIQELNAKKEIATFTENPTIRDNAFYNTKISTSTNGLLILDQNLKSPFETIFASLKSNPFKGYNSSNNTFFTPSESKNVASSSINSSSNGTNNNNDDANSYVNEDLNLLAYKHLTNYHMNLNRYLNLILYKLIFPLFNQDSNHNKTNGDAMAGLESNKNLDHLIWLFFNDYNKLIPILDFELFYNDYLNFVNKYTLKNSTYSDNGELKKRYYEFNQKDQDTLIKLILVLKFTLCQPKINENNSSSAFLPDKTSLNQLDESIKLINLKHIILMFRNINFSLSPNLDKLEITLLIYYYLIKFENYNLPNYTDSVHSHIRFLLDIININKNLVNCLNINKRNDLLDVSVKTKEKHIVEIQRLKLYWNFKILTKLAEIYFNIPLTNEYNTITSAENTTSKPASLETIVLVNNDINITLCLVKLLKIIPWNIMQLINNKNVEELKIIDSKLSLWKKSVEDLYNEDNCVVFNKLKSYYLYFKVLVNINGSIDSSYFIDFIDLVYDLTFNNPKSSNKTHDISIEAAESLCLHSFNFHLVTLISITSLQNIKDKLVCQKIYKLIQLYQILINYKDVDPLITTFVNYIRENILYSFSDANTVQNDTLKLFSSVELNKSKNGSLFDKKKLPRKKKAASFSNASGTNSMNFDLNAFNLATESFYSTDDSTISKRRKSNASNMSYMSSNASVVSKDSSIISSSRRLSASSNDSTPSLFASATSPYNNANLNISATSLNASNNNSSNSYNTVTPSNVTTTNDTTSLSSSAKKRNNDHSIQPLRTMNRSRSLSSDSKIRSYKATDRRPSISNQYTNSSFLSREGSIDANSRNYADQLTDDEMISQILQSDVDSEADSDILTGNLNKPKTIFKPNTNLLPTIPSEGNLLKIMSAFEPSAMEAMKKTLPMNEEFNVDSLFSTNSNSNLINLVNQSSDPNLLDNSTSMSKFSKAFKKSPTSSVSVANVYNNKSNSSATSPAMSPSNGDLLNTEKPLIDDDDLTRLKEHVLSLKSSIK